MVGTTAVRFHWEPQDQDYEAIFSVEFTCTPWDPGVTSGPPELCYPPEGGEVEIGDCTLVAFCRSDWAGHTTQTLADLSLEERYAVVRAFRDEVDRGQKVWRELDGACFDRANGERYYGEDE